MCCPGFGSVPAVGEEKKNRSQSWKSLATRNIYFVLEVCAGGEVLDHLLQWGHRDFAMRIGVAGVMASVQAECSSREAQGLWGDLGDCRNP